MSYPVNTLTSCRMCESTSVLDFLDLEYSPPADRFLTKEELNQAEVAYPLRVMLCTSCGFIQLRHIISPDVLYRINYPYEASITKTGREHFHSMADAICKDFHIPAGAFVVDIGSNVGVLLSGFKKNNMKILGVDPATNIAKIAEQNGIETIPEFFGCNIAQQIVSTKGQATIITATNVFAHIGTLSDFMQAIEILLAPKGMLIFEAPYFVDLYNKLEYDTIYHEHLGYLSIKPLVSFFKKWKMEIFDVQRFPIHGGTIRVFACRKGVQPVSARVSELLQLEEEMHLYSQESVELFSKKVLQHRVELLSLLFELKRQGKRIVGISAPAKGNTLLNYCKIGPSLLDYLTEKSMLKIGTFSPGMHIPVVSDAVLLEDMPDYGLILAWNFSEEIMKNLHEYKEKGGKFIIPIPNQKII